jgi:hypothetical protein
METFIDLNEQEYIFFGKMCYEEEIVEATKYMDG